jgi:hypothetical protein
MRLPKLRRCRFVLLLGVLTIGEGPTSGQNPPKWIAPSSLNDPRLQQLRRASAFWEGRSGRQRTVVDQVCLVPDLATFLDAVATWDESHYFPILLDDVETSFRFIRAFKPARIVRLPRSAAPIAADQVWARAIDSVGASWTSETDRLAYKPKGDSVPKGMGATPPGVVLSSPGAPMLGGAVALAAGRFQPLLRLDFEKQFGDLLSLEQVESFDQALTQKVLERLPNFASLGDDCDFLTIAGDWPYRYRDAKGGQQAVDDRLGRSIGSDQRWAFAGRLLGDPTESVYRAMCSLFLQPESAVMFNGYDEAAPPWSEYTMRVASLRLHGMVPTSQVSGEKQADLEGWHETFDPINRFGLVLINSHGMQTSFHLRGGPAFTHDVPRSIPASVLMIHSFSAADPTDPSTIAGRWLANGAFNYFGSMNEPFLPAFRTPRLVADLLAEGLPMVAAVRVSLAEPFGQPWRLVYLGDPLYRLKPRSANMPPRIDRWEPTDSWPVYAEPARPENGNDLDLFFWGLRAAISRLGRKTADSTTGGDLIESLLAIRRARLPLSVRPVYDALLTEVLLEGKRRSALKARIAQVPENDRSPALRRTFENLLAVDLSLAQAQKDASKARAVWRDLIEGDVPREFKEQSTIRVGQLADTPVRRQDWSVLLRATLKDHEKSPEAEMIRAELKRVVDAMQADR